MSLYHETAPISREIGARVRAARMKAGISQGKLGDALGVSFQQVQKYENGTTRIAASTLHRIAAAVGTPIMSLIGEAGAAAHPLEGLTNPQSLRVLQLYSRLDDPKLRSGVIALLESMVPALDA